MARLAIVVWIRKKCVSRVVMCSLNRNIYISSFTFIYNLTTQNFAFVVRLETVCLRLCLARFTN